MALQTSGQVSHGIVSTIIDREEHEHNTKAVYMNNMHAVYFITPKRCLWYNYDVTLQLSKSEFPYLWHF